VNPRSGTHSESCHVLPSPQPSHKGRKGRAGFQTRPYTLQAVYLILFLTFVLVAPARGELVIPFDNPNRDKMPLAVPDFVSEAPGALNGSALAGILKNDLHLTGLFKILDNASAPLQAAAADPNFEIWSRAGAQTLILGSFRTSGDELVFEGRLYDVALKKLELGKRYTGKIRDHRRIIHRFADRVMERLTGIPGCFSTKIAFTAESQSRELFTMDFDGHDLRQMTQTQTINLSPDWSPDGAAIIFTSYLNQNPDLWKLDLTTLQYHALSTQPGINASARYSPDGRHIALSLSAKGTPKIFIISPEGHIIKMLTSGRGNDISPTWSPDGNTIAYTSDGAGTPQIYTIPVGGGAPARLTFGSNYNTDPKWSPRGDLLAFTARVDGRFQICTIGTDGKDLRVLTDKGSNQDPAWSPDGRMIVFTSNRTGQRLIHIMDANGEIQVPVSRVPGKTPAWSRNLK